MISRIGHWLAGPGEPLSSKMLHELLPDLEKHIASLLKQRKLLN
jgi:hypothetical protein